MKTSAEELLEKERVYQWLKEHRGLISVNHFEREAGLGRNTINAWLTYGISLGYRSIKKIVSVAVKLGYVPTIAIEPMDNTPTVENSEG